MKRVYPWLFIGFLFACSASALAASTDDHAEIAALKQQIEQLRKSAYHPELGQQMLELQIRHARLWFAGAAQNWNLAAFEVNELREAFEAVVEQNPDNANFQPQRLADILPAMTNGPVKALRDAIDHHSKAQFEKAYDGLSAVCTGCHRAAGIDFLVIQRPTTPILDNLRTALPDKSVK
ncbi:MAG: hypothetical protein ACREPN_02530 [Rudaea sp.]